VGAVLMRGLVLVLALGACGDNRAAPAPAAPSDAPAPPTVVPAAPCLDTTDVLARPTTELPCELLPPGFAS
jgi:hypothetical protein